MKRVFTVCLRGAVTALANADIPTTLGAYTLVAQEDLVIIGATLTAYSPYHQTAEGDCSCSWELSFAATPNSDVSVLEAMSLITRVVDTSGSSQHNLSPTRTLMFPEGYGMSMKEGETLYMVAHGRNNINDSIGCSHHCTVYYVKGKAIG